MKVLWLTENYPPRRGGMAQACDRIVSNLRNCNVEVDVAHFCSHKTIKVIQQQNGKLFIIPSNDGPGHGLNCFWNLLQSADYRSEYTHIVAFGGYFPILALPIFKAWTGAKAITLLRGNDFDLGIFSPSRRGVLLDAFSASDVVSVLSSDQKTKIAPFVEPGKVFTIFNGINLEEWETDSSDLAKAQDWKSKNVEEGKLVIGLIGQLKAKKGGSFFLSNVLSSKLESNFHFLIIGDVAEDLEAWLEERKDRLSFTRKPFLDRWELLSWYPTCDYIALPSFYDGMPNVLLEAGALGIPVIAAAAGGISDVLIDESCGIIFHPGDRHSCRAGIWSMTEKDSQQRESLGINLKTRVKNHFSAAVETEAYFKMLQKTLSAKKIGFVN